MKVMNLRVLARHFCSPEFELTLSIPLQATLSVEAWGVVVAL